MKKMKKCLYLFLSLLLVFSLAACGGTPASSAPSASAPTSSAAPSSSVAASALPTQDRAGNPITLPEEIGSIISLAPSITQTLMHLGLTDKIIAVDTQSALTVEGLPEGLPTVDIMSPDAEVLIALAPDVIFATSLSMPGSEEPLAPVAETGIVIAYVPTAATIADIREDIAFFAAATGTAAKGETIVAEMDTAIDALKETAAGITEKKTVYFEIAAAPSAYSTGGGTYLNEMIEIVGGENIFASQDGWLPVTEEDLVSKNPDVIFTNVNYIDNPVQEILDRAALKNVTAVQQSQVYAINNMASSLPNEYIVIAMQEMADALYPDVALAA